MSLIARFIIDTSAATRIAHPEVKRRVRALIDGSVVGTTASLDARALAGARGRSDYERLLAHHRATREYLPTNDEHWHTALGAQRALAITGEHNKVDILDLLTAAMAAAHRLTIIHYHPGFEAAATVLTFRHRWVMPPGTI
jgi:predicted nucleic acid-binding protein